MSSNKKQKQVNLIEVPNSDSKRKDIVIREDEFEVFKVIASCDSYRIYKVDENNRISDLSVGCGDDGEKGYKELPADIWRLSALRRLYVSSFLLGSLPVGSSENLEELIIDCESGYPYHLSKEIEHLTNLKHLRLYFEGICSIPTSIGNLKQLEKLICHSYREEDPEEIRNLTDFEVPEEIGTLTNLKWLELYNIDRLPASIGNLKKLEKICIRKTSIQELPKEIGDLTSLKNLHLFKTPISSLPASIGNLKKLETISIYDTSIQELPKEIGDLIDLKNLTLTNNMIYSLPTSIGNLKKLETIYISNRSIQELPKEIGDLTSLKDLTIYKTPISSLPASIGNLKKLETICIEDTSIRELPKEIGDLTSLKNLTLRNNMISLLPTSIGNLKKLEKIYIRNTSIQELPNEIGDLTNLKDLAIYETPISSLPTSIGNFKKLETIYISGTSIQELPKEIGDLTNLKNLKLRNNMISSLPTSMGNLKKLEQLEIVWTSYPQEFPKTFRFPKEFWGLSALRKLEVLGVKGTSISIPPSIEELQNLEKLILRGDITVPKEVGNLKSLIELRLDSPKEWHSVPLESLQQLQLLELCQNFLVARVRHSNFIAMLPNLRALHVLHPYAVYEPNSKIDQDAKDFILDLVRSSRSLGEVNGVFEYEQPKTVHALACNRLSVRVHPLLCRWYEDEQSSYLIKLLPRMLRNATSASKRFYSYMEMGCYDGALHLGDSEEDFCHRPPKKRGIEMQDAVYQMLVDERGIFLQMLIGRGKRKLEQQQDEVP